jgi:hypothetical protein
VADTTDDTTKTPQPPISLRAYAKHRAAAGLPGCSPEAVSKAVKSGRLRASVVLVDGEPKIADPELADREWAERSAPRILPPTPAPASSPATPPPPPPPPPRGEADGQRTSAPQPPPQGQLIALPGGRGQASRTPPPRRDDDSGGGAGDDDDGEESYQAARERKERAAADREEANAALAAIELAERRKQVCLVSDVKLKMIGAFTACRSKLAALPSRARSRDQSLTLAQVTLLESLVREALDELAGA